MSLSLKMFQYTFTTPAAHSISALNNCTMLSISPYTCACTFMVRVHKYGTAADPGYRPIPDGRTTWTGLDRTTFRYHYSLKQTG